MTHPGTKDVVVNGFSYQADATINEAFFAVSNSHNPTGIMPVTMFYRRPADKGKSVVVYVMEKEFSYDDVRVDLDDIRQRLIGYPSSQKVTTRTV